MDLLKVLHMNGGEGETSYAKNSSVQRKISSFANPVIKEALTEMLSSNNIPQSLGTADLGCSSGPNTLMLVSEVVDIVHHVVSLKTGGLMPELRFSLNDLPGNDFNEIFMSLPDFYHEMEKEKGGGFRQVCFIAGVGGSFYGRLFPRKSLHFIHSSSSLHWLSQVPPCLNSKASRSTLNKGKIYISKTSPSSVKQAYLCQFKKDWSVFLKSRSEEMVSGGRMVLAFLGRSSADPATDDGCYQWELLAQALTTLASQGYFPGEKIDSFNAPYYAPSMEEVEAAFEEEGSFVINSFKAIEMEWDAGSHWPDSKMEDLSRGKKVAKTIRAVVEPMLESHFGGEINMDELFELYAELVQDYISKGRAKYVNFVISVTKS